MKKRNRSLAGLILSCALPIFPASADTTTASKQIAPGQPAIDQLTTLPTGDMKVIDSKGELLFMSGNGRWIIKGGTLYDAWNRKALKTVAEVDDSATRVDLAAMKIQVADFRPLSFGKGPQHITVFVDPKCPWCAKLMAMMRDTPRLGTTYTFDLLPIGMLGSESQQLTRQLGCAKDREAAREALMREDYTKPLEQVEKCDLTAMQKTLVLAHLLGVPGVPYLIAPDGRVQRGMPANLVDWLESRSITNTAGAKAKK